jgi:uncharacterized membrane protein YebE (DUF533 family)
MAEHTVTAALGIRLARSLYSRWRVMRADERERLAEIADRVKETALDLRGSGDPQGAERDLHEANERLAAAMVESAEADPEVDEIEVRHLREDLKRELERISTAEIQAHRVNEAGDRPG